jgi:hypothetical protein
MSRIKKDYRCLAHGNFESTKPVCPHGCNTVTRIHLSAPAVHTSGRSARIDSTLNGLASQYNLTDLSNRNGSVASSMPMRPTGGLQAGFVPMGNNPTQTMAQHGLLPGNATADYKFTGPVPSSDSIAHKSNR